MNNEKRLFIRCNCQSHAVELVWDDEFGWLEMSLWRYSASKYPMPFKERIRWAWQILTKGTPWADNVLLDKKEISELKKYLEEIHD